MHERVNINEEFEKDRLPAREVKNKVLWVNPEMVIPFRLKEGEQTELGLFLTPENEEQSVNGRDKLTRLEVHRRHNRSAVLGRVLIQDREGRTYRDIGIKGSGFFTFGGGPFMVSAPTPSGRLWGLLSDLGVQNLEDAEWNRDFSEMFLKNGIRTSRTISIIELEEIITEERKISVEEAKKRRLIPRKKTPVEEIIAFRGTKMRIENTRDKQHIYLEDAMSLVAKEIEADESAFTRWDYLRWFIKTFAEQLAKIHNLGYTHNYIGSHNVTLDCCIVDLDGVEKRFDESGRDHAKYDTKRAVKTLKNFASNLGFSMDKKKKDNIEAEFFSAYDNALTVRSDAKTGK